jgi:hypothetical protein
VRAQSSFRSGTTAYRKRCRSAHGWTRCVRRKHNGRRLGRVQAPVEPN